MGDPRSLFVVTLVACLTQVAPGAQAQVLGPSTTTHVTQLASVSTGSIDGTVIDDRGAPLDGVVISALGGGSAFAVTDGLGKFTLHALPPGPYLLRAHLPGYLPARRVMVNVRPSARTTSSFTLRKEATADEPRIAAAGLGGPTEIASAPESGRGRDESETAWRLRHLRRPLLKDADAAFLPPESADPFGGDGVIARAMESSARMASALFSDFPVQGQVNLLTTGAFDSPSQLLQANRTTSVAFFSVGAPVGEHGDWRVRAALNQGDLSSWIVSGTYATRAAAAHRYTLGLSYGLQRYEGGNAVPMAGPEVGRSVGSISAADDWTVSEHVLVSVGAGYAHHDYLPGPGLFSPRASVTLTPERHTRIRAVVARQLTAPGADEFLPPSRTEFVPPQRTFSALSADGFQPQRLQHYEVAIERTFRDVTVGGRVFRQRVDNQLVTVFGLRTSESPSSDLGHYFVGSAGDVAVNGWGVTVTHVVSKYVRGTVDYSESSADWLRGAPPGDAQVFAQRLPAAVRPGRERIHDLTTSVQAMVPTTATRVAVLYRWNDAFLADDDPAFDARFDIQVSQGLPFMNFLRAEWEALVAVRNVFRENPGEASVYDELLVARPPKRLVGGLTVRF